MVKKKAKSKDKEIKSKQLDQNPLQSSHNIISWTDKDHQAFEFASLLSIVRIYKETGDAEAIEFLEVANEVKRLAQLNRKSRYHWLETPCIALPIPKLAKGLDLENQGETGGVYEPDSIRWIDTVNRVLQLFDISEDQWEDVLTDYLDDDSKRLYELITDGWFLVGILPTWRLFQSVIRIVYWPQILSRDRFFSQIALMANLAQDVHDYDSFLDLLEESYAEETLHTSNSVTSFQVFDIIDDNILKLSRLALFFLGKELYKSYMETSAFDQDFWFHVHFMLTGALKYKNIVLFVGFACQYLVVDHGNTEFVHLIKILRCLNCPEAAPDIEFLRNFSDLYTPILNLYLHESTLRDVLIKLREIKADFDYDSQVSALLSNSISRPNLPTVVGREKNYEFKLTFSTYRREIAPERYDDRHSILYEFADFVKGLTLSGVLFKGPNISEGSLHP